MSEALPSFYDPSLHLQLFFNIPNHVSHWLLKLSISLVESISKDQLLLTFLVLLRGLLFFWLLGSRPQYYLWFLCSHFSFTRKLLQILFPAYVCPICSSHFIPWQPLQFWFPCSVLTAVFPPPGSVQSVTWISQAFEIICYSKTPSPQRNFNFHFCPCLSILLLIETF